MSTRFHPRLSWCSRRDASLHPGRWNPWTVLFPVFCSSSCRPWFPKGSWFDISQSHFLKREGENDECKHPIGVVGLLAYVGPISEDRRCDDGTDPGWFQDGEENVQFPLFLHIHRKRIKNRTLLYGKISHGDTSWTKVFYQKWLRVRFPGPFFGFFTSFCF